MSLSLVHEPNGWSLAAVIDACLVLVFVVIGRASHGEADGLAGLVTTAWPFLAGMAIGELATRSWRRPVALLVAIELSGGAQQHEKEIPAEAAPLRLAVLCILFTCHTENRLRPIGHFR